MFDEDMSTCEPEINDSCFKHTRQLEGWYCSCRYNHDDVGDDPTKRTNMTEGQSQWTNHCVELRVERKVHVQGEMDCPDISILRLFRGTKAMQYV